MKKLIHRTLFLMSTFAALLVASCGDQESFRISGTLEGNPTMNLRVSWYADGSLHNLITAARDGNFEFRGSSSTPAVIEISDYENRLLGRTYAANGQEITLRLNQADARDISAQGSDVAAAWADFLRAHAADTDLRPAIAGYVRSNPDNVVSTLLLTCDYDAASDPVGADSLMQLISPAARPAALTEGFNYLLQRMVQAGASEPVVPFVYFSRSDSLRTFRPSERKYSLIAFSNNRSGRTDSVVPALKDAAQNYRRRLAILEISLDSDSSDWKRSTRRDTASWEQAWGAAGFAARGVSRLGIAGLPFFILCDSTGRQLVRTRSTTAITDSLSAYIQP